jgi:N-acetylglucosamine-6-phosphate deacetylase
VNPRDRAHRVIVAARRLVVTARDGTTTDGPGWLAVEDGTVIARQSGLAPDPHRQLGTVVPGFVDIHSHGALGHDAGSADAPALTAVADFHARRGTTSLVASVATAPLDALEAAVRSLRPHVESGMFAGIHLEGPYLSPERRGAHNPALLRDPALAEVRSLVAAGAGAVRMVTIAPELPGAEECIRWLAANGVTVAIGHSDADAATASAAFGWGASVVTHLFNGMRPLHHREPGIIGAALVDDRVVVELILDGQHVRAEAAEIVRRSAPGRLALVSDSMAAAGLGDGDYDLAGSAVRVRDGVATLVHGDSLAGSTATVSVGFRTLVTAGVPLVDAVAITSATPSRALGLPDPLAVGSRADLLEIDDDGAVQRVMRRGEWLASS